MPGGDKQGVRKYLGYLGFGVGAVGMDLSYGLFNSFLTNYFTDVLFINAAFLGMVAFAARIWDGVNDPMMGTIVDNTVSKYGKFRPWILAGAVLNGIVLVFLFANPGFSVRAGEMQFGLYAYVALMYVLWDMSNTIMDIPYWSMVPTLTNDPKERNIVAAIPRFFSGFGQIIIVVLTLPMVRLLGGSENSQSGYTRWAAVCAAVLVAGCALTFFTSKNLSRIPPKREEKFSLAKAYRTVKSNDQLLVFMLTAFAYNTGWYLTTGLAVYYFKAVAQNQGQMSLFGAISGAGQAIGLVLLPVLAAKIDRNKVIKGAMVLTIVSYLLMYVAGPLLQLSYVFLALALLGCIGVGAMFVSQTIMLSDIVDYGEYKLGYRADSIVFSMKSFLQKGAYSVQSLVIGFGLWLTHYDGSLTVQPHSAQTGISVMMFLLPPAFALLALFVFTQKYKLSAQQMREVNAALEQ